jgi:hypothetical protein
MFCRHCGRELEEGRRFCIFCGAEQETEVWGAAAAGGAQAPPPYEPGPAPGKSGGMRTSTKVVIIAVVVALVAAGAALGIYFGTRNTSSGKPPNSDNTETTTPGDGTQGAASENLAYIDGKDIYTIGLDGAGRRRLTYRGDIVNFAVSPDGSRIAFVAAPGDAKIIFKMMSDGSDISQVTLPEKGLAENPAFDPSSKYIYFTRVTPQAQADIQAATPYSVGFERYNIAANSVDHLYTYGGLQEQSIEGLYADPAGGALYFNLFGSDWPSSVPHKLSLGPPVSDSVYMPMLRDTGQYTAAAFQLTGFSKKGTYISYFKAALLITQNEQTGPSQEEDACYQRVSLSGETVVASYVPAATQQGDVSGIEFSSVTNSIYYFSKVQSTGPNAPSLTLEFYKGSTGGSPAPTGLDVTVAVDPQQYTPLVWHLVAAEQ